VSTPSSVSEIQRVTLSNAQWGQQLSLKVLYPAGDDLVFKVLLATRQLEGVNSTANTDEEADPAAPPSTNQSPPPSCSANETCSSSEVPSNSSMGSSNSTETNHNSSVTESFPAVADGSGSLGLAHPALGLQLGINGKMLETKVPVWQLLGPKKAAEELLVSALRNASVLVNATGLSVQVKGGDTAGNATSRLELLISVPAQEVRLQKPQSVCTFALF
jgi:hypothetical protein